VSHHFLSGSRLSYSSILIESPIDDFKGTKGLFFCYIEFLGVVQEQVRLWTQNACGGMDIGRGGARRRRRGTTSGPVAWMRVFVCMASDLVTYEALVFMHVLPTLGREESDGVHVHSVGIAMRGWQGLVSSGGNIGVVPRM